MILRKLGGRGGSAVACRADESDESRDESLLLSEFSVKLELSAAVVRTDRSVLTDPRPVSNPFEIESEVFPSPSPNQSPKEKINPRDKAHGKPIFRKKFTADKG